MASGIPAFKVGALQTNGKSKSLSIVGADGKPDVYLYPGFLQVPFNASAYQNPEASRLNLCFNVDDKFKAQIQALDAELKKQLKPRLQEIFGAAAATIEKGDDWYRSCLKVSSMGYETLRCKLNMEGKNCVRVWDHQRHAMEIPVDWSAWQVKPKIWVRGVYVIGKECGCILDVTDAQCTTIERSCPF